MAEKGAYISDVSLLEQFNKLIEQSGETMANIEQNVSSYLGSVKEELERQLDFLREKAEEAQQRLSQAEQAASSCHASQVFVPESGEYVPTCNREDSEVTSAQEEVEECQRKYQEGQRVVSECEREIEDYKGQGGGKSLIEHMAHNQTPRAIEQMCNCIDKLYDIWAFDVSGKTFSINN